MSKEFKIWIGDCVMDVSKLQANKKMENQEFLLKTQKVK